MICIHSIDTYEGDTLNNTKKNGIIIQPYNKQAVSLNNIDSAFRICDEKRSEQKDDKDLNFASLVGINNIKAEINKIVNYVKICQKRNKNIPTLHMCFTGNPGTGKTTVARIIGQIFKEEKILSKGEFIEIHGRDLVGKYVGWTAKEVQRCVERAKGGILFIDEAYSLNSDRKGSFEDEAIATLIKEMEDKRDDLCVILAGYTEEMERLAQNLSWLLKCISSGKEHGIQNPCFVEKLDAFMLGR